MTTIAKRGLLLGFFLAAVLALAACGDDDSSASVAPETTAAASATVQTSPSAGGGGDFCERLSHVGVGFDLPPGPRDLATYGVYYRRSSAQMRAIDPPAEIAGDWRTLVETMSRVGRLIGDFDLSDPDEAQQLEQELAGMRDQLDAMEAAGLKIRAYEQQQCMVPDPPPPDTTPQDLVRD
jgi:hypothetical protein